MPTRYKCVISGCQSAAINSNDNDKKYFCQSHWGMYLRGHYEVCHANGCQQQAQLQHDQHRYCVQHKPCAEGGCPSHGAYDVEHPKQLTPYCPAHRCSHNFCHQPAPHSVDDGRDTKRFCEEHYNQWRCIEAGCTSPRKTKKAELPYCDQHIRCLAAGVPSPCRERRRPGFRYCGLHKCKRDACTSVVERGLFFCSAHKCTAFLDKNNKVQCNLPTIPVAHGPSGEPWQRYCAMHICQITLRQTIFCDHYNENRAYCPAHRCTAPGCDHVKLIDPADSHDDSEMKYCKCHHKMSDAERAVPVDVDSGVDVPGGFDLFGRLAARGRTSGG